MAFQDYVSELIAVFPRLSPEYAPTLINRAWADIKDMRLWSFLFDYGDVLVPDLISAGLATVTIGSPSVVVNAAAATALDTVALLPAPNSPLSSAILGVGRQFRIQNSNTGGPIYNIIAWNLATLTLTLDRPYAGPSAALTTYQVAKCYYATPVSDFVRYISVVNRTSGYSIRGRRLTVSQAKLNAIDPQRGGQGDAYVIASYQPDANGEPVHEWYPNPVNISIYNCFFQRRGLPLSSTNDLPASFPSAVLMYRALMLTCNWAMANVATYQELAAVNWVQVRKVYEQDFKEQLVQAVKQDDEIMPQLPFLQGTEFDFPLGGSFLQGHDVSSLVGGM